MLDSQKLVGFRRVQPVQAAGCAYGGMPFYNVFVVCIGGGTDEIQIQR